MNETKPFAKLADHGELIYVALRQRLDAMSPWKWILLSVFVAVLLSVCFLTPKFWILRQPTPGSFEWDRATTFIESSKTPWLAPAEAAMRWRMLPAWVAYFTGLRGALSLVIPWLGLLVWLGTTAWLIAKRTSDRLLGSASSCLLATSGGALAVTNFLGLNDGWYLTGLSVVTLARSPIALAVATLLCPWVDERFLIALPLAWLCRRCLVREDLLPNASSAAVEMVTLALCVAFYAICRLALSASVPGGSDIAFLRSVREELPRYLSFAPLGWFMGWRAGWLFIAALPIWMWFGGQRWNAAVLVAAVAAIAGLLLLVASDLSRSIVVLSPVMLVGVLICANPPASGPKWRLLLLLAVAVNLLLPFAHVSHVKIYNVNSLPFELFRLWKTRGSVEP